MLMVLPPSLLFSYTIISVPAELLKAKKYGQLLYFISKSFKPE